MAKFNTSIKQIQELVDLSKQSINTENLNKSIASVVSALAIMGQLATKASGSDLSKMKKQYSELLKMTKEIEDFKSKSAKKDSDNDTPAIKKKNSLYVDEMKIKEKNIKLNNKLLAFETKMQGFAGGKIKSVQKELVSIRLLEKEYKDIGNQLLTQKLTTQQINKLSLQRVDIEGKIANQQRIASNLANKGTLASNTASNFSIGKLASRMSFVTTATMSYKAIQLLQDGMRAVVNMNIELQTQLSRTFALMGNLDQKTRDVFSNKTISIMKDYNMEIKDIGDALYQIVSAQVPKDNVLYVLEEAAKLAKAHGSDLKQSADLIASVMNSYKMEVGEVASVNDMLSRTIELGRTTMEELSNEMPRLIPTAKNAGIAFSELNTAIAVMTKSGIKTNQAVTSLRQLISTLTSPTAKNIELLNKYGISYGAVNIAQDGLIGTMKKYSVLLTDEQFQVAKTRTGRDALLTMINELNDAYSVHNQILNSTGLTQKMLEERMNTFGEQVKRFGNTWLASFKSTPITKWATDVIKSINDVNDAITLFENGNSGSSFKKRQLIGESRIAYMNRLSDQMNKLSNAYDKIKIGDYGLSDIASMDELKASLFIPSAIGKDRTSAIMNIIKEYNDISKLFLDAQTLVDYQAQQPPKSIFEQMNDIVNGFAEIEIDNKNIESVKNAKDKMTSLFVELRGLSDILDPKDSENIEFANKYASLISIKITELSQTIKELDYDALNSFDKLPMDIKKDINDMLDGILVSSDARAVEQSSIDVFNKIKEKYKNLNVKQIYEIAKNAKIKMEDAYNKAFDEGKSKTLSFFDLPMFSEKSLSLNIKETLSSINIKTSESDAKAALESIMNNIFMSFKDEDITVDEQSAKAFREQYEKQIRQLIQSGDNEILPTRKPKSLGSTFLSGIGFNTDMYAMGKKISAGDASEEEILAQTEAFNQMVVDTTINSTKEMYDILEQMQIQSIENQLQRKLDALDKEEEAQINAVNSEILTEEHRNREINAITNKYNKKREKEEEKAAIKQAKINKRMAMVDATTNFATASMGIWSFSKGNPAIQIPLQLLLLAAYGANMKLISDTKFRDGGMLEGASHENGGIPLLGRSGNYYGEAEGGEIIFSKRASDKNTELLLSMNKHLSNGGDISTFLSSYLNGRSSGGNKNVGSMYRDGGMTRRFSTNGATIDSSMFERFAFIDLQGVDERQIYRMSRMGKLKDRGI